MIIKEFFRFFFRVIVWNRFLSLVSCFSGLKYRFKYRVIRFLVRILSCNRTEMYQLIDIWLLKNYRSWGNTIQNYFGMAIRQTWADASLSEKEKVYQMEKNIRAIRYHCTDFPDKSCRHVLCPIGPGSWCKWKKTDHGSCNTCYTPKVNLPVWIYDIILKDFEQLSSDELLKKCTHGKTQNANDNIIIWSRCQKIYLFINLPLQWEFNQQCCTLMKGLLESKGSWKTLTLILV